MRDASRVIPEAGGVEFAGSGRRGGLRLASVPSGDGWGAPGSDFAPKTGAVSGRKEDSSQKLAAGASVRPTGYCSRCRRTKPRSEFWPNPRVSTGLSSWCKGCARTATKASRERHRERYNAARRKLPVERVCAREGCEETFETARPQRYCSRDCYLAAKKQRGRQVAGLVAGAR